MHRVEPVRTEECILRDASLGAGPSHQEQRDASCGVEPKHQERKGCISSCGAGQSIGKEGMHPPGCIMWSRAEVSEEKGCIRKDALRGGRSFGNERMHHVEQAKAPGEKGCIQRDALCGAGLKH
jgi:hypothetical protein